MNCHKRTVFAAIAGLLGTVAAPLPTAAATHHPHPLLRARYVPRGPGKADVSLRVDHAPIRTVLRLLFRRGDQSYVLGPFVSGAVTLTLHHVPFDAALRQVLAANTVPLRQTKRGRVYVITAKSRPRFRRRRAFGRRR